MSVNLLEIISATLFGVAAGITVLILFPSRVSPADVGLYAIAGNALLYAVRSRDLRWANWAFTLAAASLAASPFVGNSSFFDLICSLLVVGAAIQAFRRHKDDLDLD